MSKKLTLIIVVIISAMSFSVAFAINNIWYEAYESGVKIFFNKKETTFDLPIVTINGNTYIPLREAAEKANVSVEWNGEDNTIMLMDNSHNSEMKEVFERLFNFTLPDTAIILDYNYHVDEFEESHFGAKISFDEKDLEDIKSNFSGWMEADERFLFSYNKHYPWWDLLDINETICAYRSFKTGMQIKSISVCSFITEGANDQYYLYVSYN